MPASIASAANTPRSVASVNVWSGSASDDRRGGPRRRRPRGEVVAVGAHVGSLPEAGSLARHGHVRDPHVRRPGPEVEGGRDHRHRRQARHAWPTRCWRRCTPHPASAWPRRRSASRSSCSSTTSARVRPRSSTRRSRSRRGEWVYDEGCLSIPRPLRRDRPAQGGAAPRAGTSTATRSRSRPTSCSPGSSSTSSTTSQGVLMFERMTRRAAQGGDEGVAPHPGRAGGRAPGAPEAPPQAAVASRG